MSIINCEHCSKQVDTDFKEMRTLDFDVLVCESCHEEAVINI